VLAFNGGSAKRGGSVMCVWGREVCVKGDVYTVILAGISQYIRSIQCIHTARWPTLLVCDNEWSAGFCLS